MTFDACTACDWTDTPKMSRHACPRCSSRVVRTSHEPSEAVRILALASLRRWPHTRWFVWSTPRRRNPLTLSNRGPV